MNRRLLAVVLVVLAARCACGQTRPTVVDRDIVFDVRPAGTQVFSDIPSHGLVGFTGPTAVRISFPLEPQTGKVADRSFHLHLQADGYKPVSIVFVGSKLAADRVYHYPADFAPGVTALEPSGMVSAVRIWVTENLGVLSLVGLGLAGLAAFVVAPRLRRMNRAVEQGEAVIDSQSVDGDPWIDRQLGDYKILDRLGAGGMGVVYRARSVKDPSQEVAIKIITDDPDHREETKHRFEHEVRIGKTLNHPSIVRLIDWDTKNGQYFVMELVRGEPLTKHIPMGGLDEPTAVALLRTTMEAVSYAHQQGVLHRDLKPDNIMVDGDRVKVMDFGLAKNKAYSNITVTGEVLGTNGYMAPEQIRETRDVDARADQYSLGVIAYEMLSDRLPFYDADLTALHFKARDEPAPSLRGLRPDISERLDACIMRMIQNDPDRRFPDLLQAIEAL